MPENYVDRSTAPRWLISPEDPQKPSPDAPSWPPFRRKDVYRNRSSPKLIESGDFFLSLYPNYPTVSRFGTQDLGVAAGRENLHIFPGAGKPDLEPQT
jgi:hypothetical protein